MDLYSAEYYNPSFHICELNYTHIVGEEIGIQNHPPSQRQSRAQCLNEQFCEQSRSKMGPEVWLGTQL